MRNARTPEQLVEGIKGWMGLVREVRRAPHGAAALAPIWRYIFSANERIHAEDIVTLLVQKVGEKDKEDIVNAAEQLREEGRREGLLEGRRTLLLKLLGVRFGGLSNAATARVNSADSTELDVWAERVLTAGTLAEVLGDV